ncbi:MAG: hypothetical protein K6T75_10200, partial [Acetobacteraceae bacterium]|nr:hypothetical protein [Acetobacteraceae bacterium]
MRRIVGPVVAYLVAASLVWSLVAAAGTPGQPAPAAPAVAAPEAEAAYLAAQADPARDEAARVRAAVDAYFTLKLESRVAGDPLDFGFAVDAGSRSGRELYNYEMGRLQYSLLGWELSNT